MESAIHLFLDAYAMQIDDQTCEKEVRPIFSLFLFRLPLPGETEPPEDGSLGQPS